MQRPMMDPTFVMDLAESKQQKKHIAWKRWLFSGIKAFWGWLVSNPFTVSRPGEQKRRVSVWSILLRTTVMWIILLPLLLGGTLVLLIRQATHPPAASVAADPNSQGLYFETVHFTSSDGTPLTGWLVPALDARRVLDEKDRSLQLRRPAIVLVHDFGRSMQQMLPLVQPMHDEGMVVLVLALRGAGTASPTGQTFGLNESKDVAAAVDRLRQTSYVDSSRIVIAGIGSGATACLIATKSDASIRAVVAMQPLKGYEENVSTRIAPKQAWLGWMEPLCRRAFEAIYSVDSQQLDLKAYASVMANRPSLQMASEDPYLLNEAGTAHQIRAFCRRAFQTNLITTVGSAR